MGMRAVYHYAPQVTGSNVREIEYWNGPHGERWVRARERVDHQLAAISNALIGFAAPRAGERVLDVGCGAGSTCRELARRGLRVTGVDISAPLLAVARKLSEGIDFLQADAAEHPFAGEHDLVFSRFGVMFFSDPIAAFANLRNALRRDGRLAFACWRALDANPWAAVPLAVARPWLPVGPPPDPNAPGGFALADGDRVRDILARAGWRDITIVPYDGVMLMGATADAAAISALAIGPLAGRVEPLDDATRARIRNAVTAAFAPYAKPDGVAPSTAAWLVGAK
jgi:SAM-dependent methyltransferase